MKLPGFPGTSPFSITLALIALLLLAFFAPVSAQTEESKEKKPSRKDGSTHTFVTSDGKVVEYSFTKEDLPWLIIPPLVVLLVAGVVVYRLIQSKANLNDDPLAEHFSSIPQADPGASNWIRLQVEEALAAGNTNELIISKYRPPAGSPAEEKNAEPVKTPAPQATPESVPPAPAPALAAAPVVSTPSVASPLPPPLPTAPASWFQAYCDAAVTSGYLKDYLGSFPLPVEPHGRLYSGQTSSRVLLLPRLECRETLMLATTQAEVVLVVMPDGVLEIRSIRA
ncbi:MAG: hypothetical protein SFY68_06665 [Candidatus Sumerlaeia bacterium]|nr:hypothetical protein [Candidatus Sumerlaeia bacterium]